MGYNVTTTGADFLIEPDKLDAAFEAMKALNKRDELKTGGAWGPRPDGTYGQISSHFAWMDEDYDKKSKDAADILKQLGFDVDVDDEGLRINYYDDKTGAEDVFLAAVAPFVKPGSWINWEGEDGSHWRQEFDGTTVTTKTGTITYE